MVARAKDLKSGKYRLAERVGRLMAKVTPTRKKGMSATSTQLVLASEAETGAENGTETHTEIVLKFEPISRRRINAHIIKRKKLEPRFVYEGAEEELAVG